MLGALTARSKLDISVKQSHSHLAKSLNDASAVLSDRDLNIEDDVEDVDENSESDDELEQKR